MQPLFLAWPEVRPLTAAMRQYEYPRYFFSNTSADIRAIFGWTCELVGASWRPANERNLSVTRRESVALLDSFIGPKR